MLKRLLLYVLLSGLLAISTGSLSARAEACLNESNLKQQEPIYEGETLREMIRYLGLNLEDSVEIRTENYIHLLSEKNRHSLDKHKTEPFMFVDVNISCDYFLVRIKNGLGKDVWRLYEIMKGSKNNPITDLFYEMRKEFFDFMEKNKDCPRKQKEKGLKVA